MELIAWEEAIAYFQQALDAMQENDDEEKRCRVLLDLSDALRFTGQMEKARDASRSAAQAARSTRSAELLGQSALRFEWAVGDVHADAETPLERLALLDEALSAMGSWDSPLRALLLARRAYVEHVVSGRDDPVRRAGWGSLLGQKSPEVVAQLREAAAMAERAGDPHSLCAVLQTGFSLSDSVDIAGERMRIAQQTIGAAREAGCFGCEFGGLHALFMSSIAAADMQTARSTVAEEVRQADRLGIPMLRSLAYRAEATLATAEGRFKEAEGFAFNALSLGQGSATAPLSYMGMLSILRFYQGRAGEMEPMWRAAVERSPGQASFRGGLMLSLLDAGKVEEAAAQFAQLGRPGFGSIPLDAQWLAAMMCLGETTFRIGKRDSTAELYEVMSPHDQGNATAGDSACYGPIARSIGIVASVLGDFANAERHLLAAIDLSEKTGLRVSLAQGRMNYGDMLLRRDGPGDREKARALLRQAVEAAQDMGMVRVLADCEAMLATA
jgi:tetratricopeptide (TPR) repeat protein